MKDSTIKSGNKLIAEFLGWRSKPYPSHIRSPFHGRSVWWSAGTTKSFCGYVGEELFHDSWELLMPVVQKIYFDNLATPEQWNKIHSAFKRPNLETVWFEVVNFIQSNYEL